MGKDAALAAIARFRAALEKHGIRPAHLVLFGSYATGRAHEWSDIDVAVVSQDFVGLDLWERIQLLSPAIGESHAPIEAIALTPEEWERKNRRVAQFAADGVEV